MKDFVIKGFYCRIEKIYDYNGWLSYMNKDCVQIGVIQSKLDTLKVKDCKSEDCESEDCESENCEFLDIPSPPDKIIISRRLV